MALSEQGRRGGGEIPRYTSGDVVEIGGKSFLPVKIGAEQFYLPMVGVGPKRDLAIAWLDIDSKRNPSLAAAVTEQMAGMLVEAGARVVVMPPSDKSTETLTGTVKRASEWGRRVRPVALTGGRASEIKRRVGEQWIDYQPVTLLGTGEQKVIKTVDTITWLGIDKYCPGGEGLVLVDDVMTTRATVGAMEQALGLAEGSKHQVIVVAREVPGDEVAGFRLGPREGALMVIPEIFWVGRDPSLLYEFGSVPTERS